MSDILPNPIKESDSEKRANQFQKKGKKDRVRLSFIPE